MSNVAPATPNDPLATAVVQILDSAESVVGGGFLVADELILTCAHVITSAGAGPGDQVRLRFAQIEGAPVVEGTVLADGWSGLVAADTAALRISALPAGAAMLALGSARGCRGHAVRSFGFPVQAAAGGHFGYGIAGDVLRPDDGTGALLQITGANDMTQGFSGGPLLDDVTGLVVGMVTAITRVDGHMRGSGIAYATATETLREVLPALGLKRPHPFLGMETFTHEHVALFHGRDVAIRKVVTAIGGNPRALLLLGASGVGKSSLLQAGVLPRLATAALPGSDRWSVLLARPGRDLRSALTEQGLAVTTAGTIRRAVDHHVADLADGRRLLVVVDQFEELLATPTEGAEGDEQLGVLRELAGAVGASRTSFVFVMRDDFYPRLSALAPDLLEAVGGGIVNIPSLLTSDDLHDIITKPLEAVGARYQEGVPERIIGDLRRMDAPPTTTGDVPASVLPVLEVALQQTWHRQSDGVLTHAAYQRVGGVAAALAGWCDDVIGRFSAADWLIARDILTALVRPGNDEQGTPPVRRQVSLTALRGLVDAGEAGAVPAIDNGVDRVIAALTASRIIVTHAESTPAGPGRAVVDLVHDALIREWATLREWVDDDHRFQDWMRRAEERRARWAGRARPNPDDFLAGSDLDEGMDWAAKRFLPRDTADFLEASRRRQRLRVRRRRRLISALTVALVAALITTGAAISQRQSAVAAERSALAGQLAAQSESYTATDPEMSALLALGAYRTERTSAAQSSLVRAASLPLRSSLDNDGERIADWAFSPDGTLLATSKPDRVIDIWDVRTGKLRTTLPAQPDQIFSLAFSPDGRTLAVGSGIEPPDDEGPDVRPLTMRLWDLSASTARVVRTGHTRGITSLAFSPDGSMLATASGGGGDDYTVRVWDVRSGRQRYALNGHQTMIYAIAFSPDGRTLASGGADNAVRLWGMATGKQRAVLKGHFTNVGHITFSPDGKLLASTTYGGVPSASRDVGRDFGTVYLWDVHRARLRAKLVGHTNLVWSVSFSRDGRRLATGGDDRTARLWNTADGHQERVFNSNTDAIRICRITDDGQTLITVAAEGPARLWDVGTGQLRATLPVGRIDEMALLSPDGATLATVLNSAGRARVRLWDLGSGRRSLVLPDGRGGVDAAVFTGTNSVITHGAGNPDLLLRDTASGRVTRRTRIDALRQSEVTFSRDATIAVVPAKSAGIEVWRIAEGEQIGSIGAQTAGAQVYALSASADGRMVVGLGADAGLSVFDTSTGRVQSVSTGGVEVTWAGISPDGRMFAAIDQNGPVRLWRVPDSGVPESIPPASSEPAISATFSPDSHRLAVQTSGNETRIWDLTGPTPRVNATVRGTPFAESVYFSPDPRILAVEGDDGINLFDVVNGERRLNIPTTGYVVSLAFSPDGRLMATAGQDGRITVWDLADGRAAAELVAHADLIGLLAFSPDGRTLLSGSADGTARLWDVRVRDADEAARQICRALGRNVGPLSRAPSLSHLAPAVLCPPG